MVKSECGNALDKLKFAFDVYDLDGSGGIDTTDFMMAMKVHSRSL